MPMLSKNRLSELISLAYTLCTNTRRPQLKIIPVKKLRYHEKTYLTNFAQTLYFVACIKSSIIFCARWYLHFHLDINFHAFIPFIILLPIFHSFIIL